MEPRRRAGSTPRACVTSVFSLILAARPVCRPFPTVAGGFGPQPGSGRQEGEAIAGLLRDALGEAGCLSSIRLVSHAEEIAAVAEQAARQARERRGVLVGVGGDGTLNVVAAAAIRAGAAFSAVPGGTFNYFGRSNGFPETPHAAIQAVLHARLRPVQVGQVNGRIFLVNASFGLYPQLLEDRETVKQQWGRSRPA